MYQLKLKDMRKHMFWMIVGCTVSMLLIFLLPLLGITENYIILIFIVAMFACHLLISMQHGQHKEYSETTKSENHELHKY